MNLFKSIDKHLESVNINIVITKNGDKLSVSFLPQLKCEDSSKEKIVPLMLKGTAEELDTEFVNIISAPLEKVSGIASNLIQFEANVKKMEKSTKIAEQAKKDGADADKKADKKLETAKKWLEKEDYKKASKYVLEALKLSIGHTDSLAMLNTLNEKDPTLKLEVPVEEAKDVTNTIKEIKKEVKEETPVQKEAKPAVPIKGKAELDIECNAFVDEALPYAEKKDFAKAKELLEKGLAIQPKHQRAAGALKKVLEWMEAPAEADKAIAKVEANVAKAESLTGTDKPRRKDGESMDDFLARENAWEIANPPVATTEETPKKIVIGETMAETKEPTSKEKEDAFNAEGPDENSIITNESQPVEDDDDEF